VCALSDPTICRSVAGEVGRPAPDDGEGVDAGGFVALVQELNSNAATTIVLAVFIGLISGYVYHRGMLASASSSSTLGGMTLFGSWVKYCKALAP